MKNTKSMFLIFFVTLTATLSGFNTHVSIVQSDNMIMLGGTRIQVDMTSCSMDNSSDGRSRAIAAINNETSSMCVIQFGTRDPASGTYITVNEEPIGTGQVTLSGSGSLYDGGFVATAGQAIIITNVAGKYYAAFKDIQIGDPSSKKISAKKISGSYGCN